MFGIGSLRLASESRYRFDGGGGPFLPREAIRGQRTVWRQSSNWLLHSAWATLQTSVSSPASRCSYPTAATAGLSGRNTVTRETDLLRPESTVGRVDALVLSGGSAFGLAAADGVTNWLAAHGHGLAVGPARVPIV